MVSDSHGEVVGSRPYPTLPQAQDAANELVMNLETMISIGKKPFLVSMAARRFVGARGKPVPNPSSTLAVPKDGLRVAELQFGDGPLAGFLVAFSGTFELGKRSDAERAATENGAICVGSISQDGDGKWMLVSGPDEFTGRAPTTKFRIAEKAMHAGRDVQIVTELDFWAMVGGPPAAPTPN